MSSWHLGSLAPSKESPLNSSWIYVKAPQKLGWTGEALPDIILWGRLRSRHANSLGLKATKQIAHQDLRQKILKSCAPSLKWHDPDNTIGNILLQSPDATPRTNMGGTILHMETASPAWQARCLLELELKRSLPKPVRMRPWPFQPLGVVLDIRRTPPRNIPLRMSTWSCCSSFSTNATRWSSWRFNALIKYGRQVIQLIVRIVECWITPPAVSTSSMTSLEYWLMQDL